MVTLPHVYNQPQAHRATPLEAATIEEAEARVALHPGLQLCLLDLSFNNEGGVAGLTRIKQGAPQAALVVISGAEDNATIHACLHAGAMSFIPKSLGPDGLTQALQHVLQGKVYLPGQLLSAGTDLPSRPSLTSRHLQVLQCLGRGLLTKLITRQRAL